MKIGKSTIGKNQPVYIIAEVGNNHNGNFQRALQLVDLAKEMGADCVKFQMRNLAEVYRGKTLSKQGDDLTTEYTLDLLRRFELTIDQHKEISIYCKKQEITYLCTPWDFKSVEVLESMGVEAYKVASADLTNLPLIEKLIQTKKPLILSTGMSHESEIEQVVSFLNDKKANFALLHCNSTYPAPFHSINLNYLQQLKKIHPTIGYSGHERGLAVSLAAVTLGAKILERHFTLDRNLEGPDHAASLEFNKFQELISGVREIEQALGTGVKKVSQGELINRENLAKSIVSSKSLSKGHIITKDDILIRSPGLGLSALKLNDLLGKELSHDMEEEDYFYQSDIDGTGQNAKQYQFSRPWGVPVRYHDFKYYNENVNSDLIEFHLSYSDMDLKLEDYFTGTYQQEFVVHAPELFKDSQLMDLATPDDQLRSYSIQETQRVIEITKNLKKYFPKTARPLIVANIGGFSRDGNISEELKQKYYEIFFQSLKELNQEGIEIIPQTMAPFPWHFGGQRYQNLFVHAEEIVKYCKEYNLRMCFDISHSCLTSNHFKTDFYHFAAQVAPYTAHLHLGDASGVDGEGIQIGEGSIDFDRLSDILKKECPTASFIPEIWQGHKNNGEGFWIALDKLQATAL